MRCCSFSSAGLATIWPIHAAICFISASFIPRVVTAGVNSLKPGQKVTFDEDAQ